MLLLVLLPGSLSAGLHDSTYDHLFQRYAQVYTPEYDWHWGKAQAYQESRYNPAAVSPVGATGLMQIMPGTGREMAVRTGITGPLTSPVVNTVYGFAYMRRMLDVWSSPRPAMGRLELAHASYNAGVGHIINAQRLAGGALFWDVISRCLHRVTGRHSKETIDYVRLIKQWYRQLTEEVI